MDRLARLFVFIIIAFIGAIADGTLFAFQRTLVENDIIDKQICKILIGNRQNMGLVVTV